jgi:hypothetical protein
MAKPVPETLAEEIVMLAVPEFVMVMDCEPLLPTATLPKLTLVGLAASSPCAPVPLSAMVAGDPGALLPTEIVPEVLPGDAGANCATTVTLAPTLMVWGKPSPVTLNP